MASATLDRVPAPTITDLRAVPAVAAGLKRKAEFLSRREVVERRLAAIAVESAKLKTKCDPATMAARLRAGEAVEFGDGDTAALEREAKPLLAESLALEAAAEQEQLVIDKAIVAATEALLADLGPHLSKLDRLAATAFSAFSAAREARLDLSRDLTAKGYPDLALDVAVSGILPAMGSAAEKESPMGLHLRHLADRGLIKL